LEWDRSEFEEREMSGKSGGEPKPNVIEVTAETFEREVMARSRTVPVVIDFWAPWCGPCRVLGPLLEKLAAEYAGRFVLAKVNTEEAPELAGDFGVRSIPAVYAIREGRAIDGFVGVQPEKAIRAWLEGIMPTPADDLVKRGLELETRDPKAAEAAYRTALELKPGLAAAQQGLARLALARGALEEVADWVKTWEREGFLEPEAERIKAELTLRQMASTAPDVASARAALAAQPNDPQLRLALADALAAHGQHAEALEIALDLVETAKNPVRDAARKTMVAIFQLLPPDSELLAEYQRRLSLALSEF